LGAPKKAARRAMKIKAVPPDELFPGLTIVSTGFLLEAGLMLLLMD
jgi:hypothetical protein